MTAFWDGPCGEVRLLDLPSWLIAEPAMSACTDSPPPVSATITPTKVSPLTYLGKQQRK